MPILDHHKSSRLVAAANILLGIAILCLLIRTFFFFHPMFLMDGQVNMLEIGQDFIGRTHTSIILVASYFIFCFTLALSSLIKVYGFISTSNKNVGKILFLLPVLLMVFAFLMMNHFYASTLIY